MRAPFVPAAAALLSLALLSPASGRAPVPASVSVCFIPAEQDCFTQIAAAIGAAQHEIRVQAYGFTSTGVIGALAAAKRRGVDVEVLLDKSDERQQHGGAYTGATFLARAGVPVWIDRKPAIAHNKAIVIDGHLVIGGSANYTKAAEDRNAENVTFTESAEVAGWFLENWASRRVAAERYTLPE